MRYFQLLTSCCCFLSCKWGEFSTLYSISEFQFSYQKKKINFQITTTKTKTPNISNTVCTGRGVENSDEHLKSERHEFLQ